MRIGVIADTHMPAARAELWDEVAVVFGGVDLILHAGEAIHTASLMTRPRASTASICAANPASNGVAGR